MWGCDLVMSLLRPNGWQARREEASKEVCTFFQNSCIYFYTNKQHARGARRESREAPSRGPIARPHREPEEVKSAVAPCCLGGPSWPTGRRLGRCSLIYFTVGVGGPSLRLPRWSSAGRSLQRQVAAIHCDTFLNSAQES